MAIGMQATTTYAAQPAAAATATEAAPADTAAKPSLWAAVQAGTDNPQGRREYTGTVQVERLLTLLPGADQRIDAGTHTAGRVPMVVELHRSGAVEEYRFYPQGYVTVPQADGSEVWYSATTSHWKLLTALTDWEPYPLDGTLQYKGEPITEVYSFYYGNRSYHRVFSAARIAEILELLEKYPVNEEATFGNVGFLIVTEEDRHPLYFDPETSQVLINLSGDCIRASDPLIQWLVYIDTDNIESITCTTPVGRASLGGGDSKRCSLSTKNRDSIERLSGYLSSMIVKEDSIISWEPVDKQPQGTVLTMDIVFSTGTTYHITTDKNSLTISCPQMEEHITYRCYPSRLQGLYDLISLMPGAKVI